MLCGMVQRAFFPSLKLNGKVLAYFLGLDISSRSIVFSHECKSGKTYCAAFCSKSLAQMTSKCSKDKKLAHEPSVSLMFLPHFDSL